MCLAADLRNVARGVSPAQALRVADGKDQIIAFGAADYTASAPEFDAGQSVVRPVLGGTGKYMGARGQVTSTRNTDGTYTQVFTLLK